MKIGIITDTNMLELSDDLRRKNVPFLSNTKIYLDYIESLNSSKTQKLIYIMPNIILEELYQHKLKKFNAEYELFEKRYNDLKYGMQGSIAKNNYERQLIKEKKEWLNNFFGYISKIFF